jgi:uncharacterized coiled-coil protein SlyX
MSKKVVLTADQAKKHHEILLRLLDARAKLMKVDPEDLTLEQHLKWRKQVLQLGEAISATQNAILTSISDAYAKLLPKIDKATARLDRDLQRLKAVNEILGAVNAVLGTITNIVKLLG